MRLWSLHPKYLDAKGLVALWREALLAQAVLRGETRGYTRHPQLLRFRQVASPLDAIASYLQIVQSEALRRGYNFDAGKIAAHRLSAALTVTRGQIDYEWHHLLAKLQQRDPERYESQKALTHPRPHPLFRIVPGEVATWEIVDNSRQTRPAIKRRC